MSCSPEPYPSTSSGRDRWIRERRGPKARLNPLEAYASLWEEEAGVPTATLFLTNRECPFRCVMCDLWTHTLDTSVDHGAIPSQMARALASLPPARQIKLYNAGSFFDPRAIPPEDDREIARLAGSFERVIVESHPAFLDGDHGRRCLRLAEFLAERGARLEVAVGLETAHPESLGRLNKRMTVQSFRRAAAFLCQHGISLRVFLLLNPPFIPAGEQSLWVRRSIDEAAACGARVCSIIPVRTGNGALEALPDALIAARLTDLEAAIEYGLAHGRMQIIGDEWDLTRLNDCVCAADRVARVREMNRAQIVVAPVACDACTCDAS